MVRSPKAEVGVVCVPTDFDGIAAGTPSGFIPYQNRVYSIFYRTDTGEGVNGQPVGLWRSFDYGRSATLIDTRNTERKYDRDGWIEFPVTIDTEGDVSFQLVFVRNKRPYCSAESLWVTVKGMKKATDLDCTPTRPVSAPDQPYKLYGRLYQLEPEKKGLNEKKIHLYESSDNGATWTQIAVLTTKKTLIAGEYFDGWWEYEVRRQVGTFLYYAEFEGDAEYHGCGKQGGPCEEYGPVYF